MLRTEYAISILKERLAFGKREYSGVATDYLEAIATAVSALREKAERETGCVLCKEHPITISASTVENGGGAMTFYATFCPMCGRKLTGGNKNEC